MPSTHYHLWWHGKPYTFACGLTFNKVTINNVQSSAVPGGWSHTPVTCEGCLKSLQYQEALSTLEIGFDNNVEAWVASMEPDRRAAEEAY